MDYSLYRNKYAQWSNFKSSPLKPDILMNTTSRIILGWTLIWIANRFLFQIVYECKSASQAILYYEQECELDKIDVKQLWVCVQTAKLWNCLSIYHVICYIHIILFAKLMFEMLIVHGQQNSLSLTDEWVTLKKVDIFEKGFWIPMLHHLSYQNQIFTTQCFFY